jgi:hypothetical protein
MIEMGSDSPRDRMATAQSAYSFRHLLGLSCALLGLCWGVAFADDGMVQSGSLHIEQVQLAFIGSGNLGGGTLTTAGRKYSFSVGGLGIGGFGVSKITADGEVYNMPDARYFPGAYVQGRYGFAVGELSAGDLWLKNGNGVVLHLKAERQGLALSLGADAVYINFD